MTARQLYGYKLKRLSPKVKSKMKLNTTIDVFASFCFFNSYMKLMLMFMEKQHAWIVEAIPFQIDGSSLLISTVWLYKKTCVNIINPLVLFNQEYIRKSMQHT